VQQQNINLVDPYASVDEVREAFLVMRNDFSKNLAELKDNIYKLEQEQLKSIKSNHVDIDTDKI